MAKYKLIIADDEYLVRKGIAVTIDWAALGVEVVAECENGRRALEEIERLRPDLVISDVRMPVMDGLELAEELHDRGFDGAIIFYSGYSDFEYVRKALDYGVSAYVLKPEENGVLAKKAAETLAALEARRAASTALKSLASGVDHIRQLYFGKLEDGVDDLSLRSQLAVLNISLPQAGTVVYARALRTGDEFERFFGAIMCALENFGAAGYMGGGKFIVVTALSDTKALADCVERLTAECSGAPFSAVGISAPFGSKEGLAAAAMQAKNASSSVLGASGVFVCSESDGPSGKKFKKLIGDALALIREHYGEKITVKWAAEKLFVSESHLMHEFKEETGSTFNDCLKQYRVSVAKRLIKRGDMRVNEIASAVGFSDGRYFGQVFKEVTGVTPSEYLERADEEE